MYQYQKLTSTNLSDYTINCYIVSIALKLLISVICRNEVEVFFCIVRLSVHYQHAFIYAMMISISLLFHIALDYTFYVYAYSIILTDVRLQMINYIELQISWPFKSKFFHITLCYLQIYSYYKLPLCFHSCFNMVTYFEVWYYEILLYSSSVCCV